MASDPLALVRTEIGDRIAELQRREGRLSPLAVHGRISAIGALAAQHGLAALETLARASARRAMLPGYRIALRSCLESMADALDSREAADSTPILAALAVRLH